MPERWIGTSECARLNALLSISTDAQCQDWQYIASDGLRLAEFVAAYHLPQLNDDDRFALMALIVSSAHDALDRGILNAELWSDIQCLLVTDATLHAHTILYWCVADATCDDEMFTLTPRMRAVWNAAFDS
ncbi:hypothetical protein RESH_04570 [Rhodopirellula europaea SH398]|uniref:Uncharacterized protein n=1 Tax=Rhodopirellula europaea SH398 TaxID=1263868 RepID=M5RZS7_9BACT|nr:hypothetical protein RESH_04570 [Rhodopirellula europaea SH398]